MYDSSLSPSVGNRVPKVHIYFTFEIWSNFMQKFLKVPVLTEAELF